jgi:molybdopterin-guanine dinucleotide biosynthesis protein B
MIDYPLPIVGFCAFSGTGKTTLLKRLLPLLKLKGLRIGVVKHAHHQFDIDQPGKDSYELRQAGAAQMLVASHKRLAWVKELPDENTEPGLQQTLQVLDTNELDLVLVEGFKQTSFPKIELHRPSLGKPLLYSTMPGIIAIATDTPLTDPDIHLVQLNLNQPAEIANFIIKTIVQSPDAVKFPQIKKGANHAH